MVEVAPFKGITYNKEKISKLDDVMSPPYDIISSEMQQALYEQHPYNFVRLILGKQHPNDSEKNNRYTRAQAQFSEWINKQILIATDKPSIYPYKIEYKVQNQKRIMSGFFILLRLDPEYKLVKAHERTLSKPKADRLNIMRACKANLEPIELLYIDETDELQKQIDLYLDAPLIEVKGYDTFTHTLWKCDDQALISAIQQKLSNKILFIADGHHRYQTAVNYAQEMKEKTQNNDPVASFNYRMVILANMFDEGLAILPTHRLITLPTIDHETLRKRLGDYFVVEEKNSSELPKNYQQRVEKIKRLLRTKMDHKFVMYFKETYYILTLKEEYCMKTFTPERSQTWQTLDVSILHKIILEHLLGITEDTLEDHVRYTRDDEEALRFVDEGKYDASFLLNATKIQALKAIAEAGEHMPQKSTYFLPKMLSGLVMYKM